MHDPSAYVTPDTVLDFTGVRFTQDGDNRVRMTGACGGPRPDRLKIIGFLAGR